MALTFVALVLFMRDQFPLETSSLLIFIILVTGFQFFPYERDGVLLSPQDLFAGFGHEALVAVCALMILGKGLETTGALQPIARILARIWRASPSVSLLSTLLVAAALSAVMNNTPIVVMLLPILVGVTLSAGASPSGILIPFGFSTIIGGSVTTIGTSTNLLVVSVASDLGVGPFGVFDFAAPLALVGLGGIFYLWLIAPRLLPVRDALIADKSQRLFSALLYVEEDSKIVGRTLQRARAMAGGQLRLLDVKRGNVLLARLPTLRLAVGDRLHLLDTPERLKELEAVFGTPLHDQEIEPEPTKAEQKAALKAEASAAVVAEPSAGEASVPAAVNGETPETSAESQEDAKQHMVEVVVTKDSPLNGSTVKWERFADDYGLYVLAIHRGQLHQEIKRKDLGDVVLAIGDVLLVQGAAGDIRRLKANPAFLVLDSSVDLPDTHKAPVALGIMGLVVASAAAGMVPISVAALIGVAMMIVSGCLTWKETGSGLSAQVIMIVVTSLALGSALTATGGTDYVAELFTAFTSGLPPRVILAGLILLVGLLTNIISNNAAGIIGTPIAIGIARKLGLAPEPFVIGIIAGVNLSFVTPMAYQTNLLVMHAGGYRFFDFVRVGAPLAVLMWMAYAVLIPVFFPF